MLKNIFTFLTLSFVIQVGAMQLVSEEKSGHDLADAPDRVQGLLVDFLYDKDDDETEETFIKRTEETDIVPIDFYSQYMVGMNPKSAVAGFCPDKSYCALIAERKLDSALFETTLSIIDLRERAEKYHVVSGEQAKHYQHLTLSQGGTIVADIFRRYIPSSQHDDIIAEVVNGKRNEDDIMVLNGPSKSYPLLYENILEVKSLATGTTRELGVVPFEPFAIGFNKPGTCVIVHGITPQTWTEPAHKTYKIFSLDGAMIDAEKKDRLREYFKERAICKNLEDSAK